MEAYPLYMSLDATEQENTTQVVHVNKSLRGLFL